MFYASWVKQTWTIQMWPGTIPFTVSRAPNPDARWLYYACGVNGFNIPVSPHPHFVIQLPSARGLGRAMSRDRLGPGRSQCAKALRWTVDHRDRHLGCDAPPVLPAMKLREIVSAHDPDKAQAGSAGG